MPTTEGDAEQPKSGNSFLLASGRELSKSSLFFLLHSAGWIIAAGFGCASDWSTKGAWAALMENLSWAGTGWVLSLGFRPVYRWARLSRPSYAVYGLLCVLLSAAGAVLWYIGSDALVRLCYHALRHLAGSDPLFAAAARADALMPWWIPLSYWVYFTGVLFTWSSLYFGINAMIDVETERAKVARALKLADSARLTALQANLNPHFLFNALNGIATLVREEDVTGASAMIDALSVLLRATLQRLNTPEIQVSEELQLIEQYLRIQRFRFGDRLRANVVADPDTLDALIPTLIVQPLVENAVRHGVLPREDGGTLWVSICREVQTLVVSVEDDGVGVKHDGANSAGLGLKNSRERLAALYGNTAQLTVGSRTAGAGFAVAIRMPFRRAAGTRAPDRTVVVSS
jgi:two-component system, LytTR family, sensor kinase